MRTWHGCLALAAGLALLGGCGTPAKRVVRPPHVEEFVLPPAEGDRFNKPTEYPERKDAKLKDGGPMLPSMNGPGMGGQAMPRR